MDKMKGRTFVSVAILIGLIVHDIHFFYKNEDGRVHATDYIADIRVIHQYCNYALGLISLILGLMIGRLEDVRKHVGAVDILPFIIALFAAGFCIIFFPVSYQDQQIETVRRYWLMKLILHQVVVICTIHGLISISMRVYRIAKD